MLSVAHTLISLPFGIYLTNPWLIFLAAATFHFFCDTLLHWNIYPDKLARYPVFAVAVDVIAGPFIAWLILGPAFFTLPVLAAIVGGNMPDVLHGLWELLNKNLQKKAPRPLRMVFGWHESIQLETDHVGIGLISQIILITISLSQII